VDELIYISKGEVRCLTTVEEMNYKKRLSMVFSLLAGLMSYVMSYLLFLGVINSQQGITPKC